MDKSTFCAAPWLHIFIGGNGQLAPCCGWDVSELTGHYSNVLEFYNGDRMRQLRRDLHNGIQVKECHNCWQEEQDGKHSMRQVYTKDLLKYNNLHDLDTQTWLAELPISLDLELGNLCNLKCVMCTPDYSTSIGTEFKLHRDQYGKLSFLATPSTEGLIDWPNDPRFKDFIDQFKNRVLSLRFAGGEPSIIPYVQEFLDSIPNPDQVHLEITTNAYKLTNRFLETISRFKYAYIVISLEGVGYDNDQIRYGGKFEEIVSNIQKLNELDNTDLTINYVFQCFSIRTFLPLLEWCDSKDLRLDAWSIFGSHPYLDFNSVPPDLVEEFRKKLIDMQSQKNNTALESARNKVERYKYDPVLNQQMKQYLMTLDQIRGTQLSNYF